jgi:hypothetical protein
MCRLWYVSRRRNFIIIGVNLVGLPFLDTENGAATVKRGRKKHCYFSERQELRLCQRIDNGSKTKLMFRNSIQVNRDQLRL